MTWTLQTILALVERGLEVEIRCLPPPTQEGEGQEATIPPEFERLKEIIPQLVFPPVEGSSVLDLPPPEPEAAAEPAETKTKKGRKS